MTAARSHDSNSVCNQTQQEINDIHVVLLVSRQYLHVHVDIVRSGSGAVLSRHMYPVSRTYKYAEEDEVSWEGPAHVLATSQYNYADQCSDAGNNNINSVIFIRLEHRSQRVVTVRRRITQIINE